MADEKKGTEGSNRGQRLSPDESREFDWSLLLGSGSLSPDSARRYYFTIDSDSGSISPESDADQRGVIQKLLGTLHSRPSRSGVENVEPARRQRLLELEKRMQALSRGHKDRVHGPWWAKELDGSLRLRGEVDDNRIIIHSPSDSSDSRDTEGNSYIKGVDFILVNEGVINLLLDELIDNFDDLEKRVDGITSKLRSRLDETEYLFSGGDA